MDLSFLVIVGRIIMGAAFVVSGVRMAMSFPMVIGLLTAKKAPFPGVAAAVGVAVEIVLGILVVFGIWLVPIAVILAVFVLAATILVHDFWNQEGMQKIQDQNTWLSNLIIIGALLAIAGYA
jgi:putative oxidoreductase